MPLHGDVLRVFAALSPSATKHWVGMLGVEWCGDIHMAKKAEEVGPARGDRAQPLGPEDTGPYADAG